MNDTTATAQQLRAAVSVTAAIAEVIRELREVPSGTLYAQVMNTLSADDYQRVLGLLSNAKLISVDGNHLIRWIGPNF
jgi:hypothetical protein